MYLQSYSTCTTWYSKAFFSLCLTAIVYGGFLRGSFTLWVQAWNTITCWSGSKMKELSSWRPCLAYWGSSCASATRCLSTSLSKATAPKSSRQQNEFVALHRPEVTVCSSRTDQFSSTVQKNTLEDQVRWMRYRSKVPLWLSKSATPLTAGETWGWKGPCDNKMIQKLSHSILRAVCYHYYLPTVTKKSPNVHYFLPLQR